MKTKFYFLLMFLFFGFSVLAQQNTFYKLYHYNGDAHGYCVRQTADGGFIVAGYTYNSDSLNEDALVFKTNNLGDTIWTKKYGGNGEYDDQEAKSIIETGGGGYTFTGVDWVTSGSYGLYLKGISSTGSELWEQTHKFSLDMNGNDIVPATGGGYVTAGYYGAYSYFSYIMLNKYNSNGDTAWSKLYNFSGSMHANSLRAPDASHGNGYIILGRIYFNSSYDMYAIRTNDNGDTLWTKNYGGSYDEEGKCVQQTSDGGYILAGYQENANGYNNIYVIKINSSGGIQWEKSYGVENNDERGKFILQTSDNGFVIAGDMHTTSNYDDVFLMKINSNGDSLWSKIYSGPSYESAEWMDNVTGGGFVITGSATDNFDDVVLLIKTDANGNVVSGINESAAQSTIVKIYPNPFSINTIIKINSNTQIQNASLSIYNIIGDEVHTINGINSNEIKIERNSMTSGMYFFKICNDKEVIYTGKLMVQ